MSETITHERIERYLSLTAEARKKATPITSNKLDEGRLAEMLRMCDDYTRDARHFASEGDLVSSFGAINYAHAWLDLSLIHI